MDDATMKLGLLMEAAQANQKAIEGSLRKLKAASGDLVAVIREEVQRGLTEGLHSIDADTRRASDCLRAVGRAANVRILLWSLGLTGLCSAVPLTLIQWLIPSRTEIASLRRQHDDLVDRISKLEEDGGRIDLRRCGGAARLCVRVDRKAPAYGEQSDYLIVRGY